MSRIRSRNTKLEVEFLKKLSAELYPEGYRYRKHYKKLPGNPDIAFPRHKLAIFIDGDFWHGYNLEKLRKKPPKKYWATKIKRNIMRDRANAILLKKMGWSVLRLWEHHIEKNPQAIIRKIEQALSHK